ncbi:hypothetical protein ACQJBY_053645 [Aegilops geniculata]
MVMLCSLTGHLVLTSILSRHLLYTSTMIIPSKSTPLYALLLQQILMVIVCIFIILSHLLLKRKHWNFSAWRSN